MPGAHLGEDCEAVKRRRGRRGRREGDVAEAPFAERRVDSDLGEECLVLLGLLPARRGVVVPDRVLLHVKVDRAERLGDHVVDPLLRADKAKGDALLVVELEVRVEPAHDVDDGGGPLLGVAVADQFVDLRGELGEEDLDLLCEELAVELLAHELHALELELALAAVDRRLSGVVQVHAEDDETVQTHDRPADGEWRLAEREAAQAIVLDQLPLERHLGAHAGDLHLEAVGHAQVRPLGVPVLRLPPLEVVIASSELDHERLDRDESQVPRAEDLPRGRHRHAEARAFE
mmetsp:Transcript_39253/g.123786  ORF Transcript_39253/g.123786 Transcript_39253/m.123786 type:complete len:289 (+) Transcript_39253:780-1646(+)